MSPLVKERIHLFAAICTILSTFGLTSLTSLDFIFKNEPNLGYVLSIIILLGYLFYDSFFKRKKQEDLHSSHAKSIKKIYSLNHASSHKLRDANSEITKFLYDFSIQLHSVQKQEDLSLINEQINDKNDRILCDYSKGISYTVIEKLEHFDSLRRIDERYKVFIKMIKPIPQESHIGEFEIITPMMDPTTYNELESEIKQNGHTRIKVKDNIAYDSIANHNNKQYVCNDFSKLVSNNNNGFNFKPEIGWEGSDNSVCVVPIRSPLKYNPSDRFLFGFIVVLCRNKDMNEIFSGKRDSESLNILRQSADELASLCIYLEDAVAYLQSLHEDRLSCFLRNRRANDPTT